ECSTSHHLVEANLLYGEKGLVVALANWSAGELKGVEVRVKTERRFQQPYAIRKPLKNVRRGADGVRLSLDIDAIDFILLPFE
ncbi:MAG: hypothetical protein QF886_11905, partial [Planctomycetota bacterium]|nr:hypothetical protein [Planctomycetota bacterium]